MTQWIEWKGGKCPVPEGTKVDLRFRDGDVFYGQYVGGDTLTGPCFWRNEDSGGDIVAYRIQDCAENKTVQHDAVNHPAHYTAGEIECIDAIRAALTPEEFRGYCKGNVLKYVWRERYKGGDESLRKAGYYLNKAASEVEV